MMNERIKQLIYKADEVEILPDEDFCDTDFLADMDPRRVKVFAELLIKECATIANRADNTETEIRCMYDVITEHFRVEE